MIFFILLGTNFEGQR